VIAAKEPLKNVGEAVSSRQKSAKKRSLCVINEHFKPIFNAEMAMQIVFQRFLNDSTWELQLDAPEYASNCGFQVYLRSI